jgi:hypothetical protein
MLNDLFHFVLYLAFGSAAHIINKEQFFTKFVHSEHSMHKFLGILCIGTIQCTKNDFICA